MPAMTSPRLALVVNAHREGCIAQRSIHSASIACATAESEGFPCELIVCLDRPDDLTRAVVAESPWLRRGIDRVLEVDVGDLGLARNAAVQAAGGELIGVMDADDYVSRDWVTACARILGRSRRDIVHPEWIVQFGAREYIYRQIGADNPDFDARIIIAMNPWNSCAFAARDAFLESPYVCARPGETGFGFEDWHWNCETSARGYRHVVAPETVHFVRLKPSNSLNAAHAAIGAIVPSSRLFDR